MRYYLCLLLMLSSLAASPEGAVKITDSIDEGMEAFRIETASAVYFYQKEAGGFSSILDRDGRDWIGYRDSDSPEYPASAASDYRGLPNLVFRGAEDGAGHPGFRACRSVLISSDAIRTESESGSWIWEWRFFDDHVEMKVLKTDPSRAYWFLYEGTPGGRYLPVEQYWGTDRGGPRRDTPDYLAGRDVYGEWKWAYFGDNRSGQVLFMVSLREEAETAGMGYLGADQRGLEADEGMVVFGFGRERGAVPLLKGRAGFTVGFYPTGIETSADHAEFEDYLRELMVVKSSGGSDGKAFGSNVASSGVKY